MFAVIVFSTSAVDSRRLDGFEPVRDQGMNELNPLNFVGLLRGSFAGDKDEKTNVGVSDLLIA